jgi:hypothetical protein
MITDMFAKAKPTQFVLEQGGMPYGTPGWWYTHAPLTPSIAVVLSTSDGPICSQVTSSFVRVWQSPKWYAKFAAIPILRVHDCFSSIQVGTDPL